MQGEKGSIQMYRTSRYRTDFWIGYVRGWWDIHIAVDLQHIVPPLEGFPQIPLAQQIIQNGLKRAKARLNALAHAVSDELGGPAQRVKSMFVTIVCCWLKLVPETHFVGTYACLHEDACRLPVKICFSPHARSYQLAVVVFTWRNACSVHQHRHRLHPLSHEWQRRTVNDCGCRHTQGDTT